MSELTPAVPGAEPLAAAAASAVSGLVSKKLAAVVTAGVAGISTGVLSGTQLTILLCVYVVVQGAVDLTTALTSRPRA